jgi:hypothetical protein
VDDNVPGCNGECVYDDDDGGAAEAARAVAESRRRTYAKMPAALLKACEDTFVYAAYVKHLGLVTFSSACVTGDGWVRLLFDDISQVPEFRCKHHFGRGVDVRLEDIRWVADCPHGS